MFLVLGYVLVHLFNQSFVLWVYLLGWCLRSKKGKCSGTCELINIKASASGVMSAYAASKTVFAL